MSRSATRCSRGSKPVLLYVRGNTITALGSHEWLASATIGATHIPIGFRAGSVRVNVFVENYNHPHKLAVHEERAQMWREEDLRGR